MTKITPVVMAGGSGTRMWPMSRTDYPKQFLNLNSQSLTMLQETLARLDGLDLGESTVITNEEHRFLVAENLRALGATSSIILEPVGKNTAPAIALAAFHALNTCEADESPVLLVLAADHVIENPQAFQQGVSKAKLLAEKDNLVTFGIVPTGPATGYGYIKQGVERQGGGFVVERFVEKPSYETAQDYVDSGNYLWNSGMFMFKAERYLQELEKYSPRIYQACKSAIASSSQDLDFIRVDQVIFEACPDNSIDYAVMEKTSDAVVVPLKAGWSDVGSWSALWDIKVKDSQGNVEQGDIISLNSKNNYIVAEEKLVATIGLENLVIVDTKDALLIANKDKVQDVKEVVAKLKEQGRSEYVHHREVYRPWGKYDSIDSGERYQVKHITVNPGAKLSLQKHHHRAEHWIVVSGTAEVTNGENTFLVGENESTYIPIGVVHSLANPGKIPLELIEVQSGSYLGEDDIVRLQDVYGRAGGEASGDLAEDAQFAAEVKN